MYAIGDLTKLIEKFDNEKFKGLTDFEHIEIFNALKYLEMYQKIGSIQEFMDLKADKSLVEKIISNIENELEDSNYTEYKCDDGSVIFTDVGYVEGWFNEYKHILRKKYCKKDFALGYQP